MADKTENEYYELIEMWPHTSMVELVMPSMTNGHGTLFGGKALEMMDKAAAVVALRHSRKDIVTAGMESVSFEAPIAESEIVEVIATLIGVGRTSMKVEVEVWGENPKSGERRRCTKATLTMVALSNSKPSEVPSLLSSLSKREKNRISDQMESVEEWRSITKLMYPENLQTLDLTPSRFEDVPEK